MFLRDIYDHDHDCNCELDLSPLAFFSKSTHSLYSSVEEQLYLPRISLTSSLNIFPLSRCTQNKVTHTDEKEAMPRRSKVRTNPNRSFHNHHPQDQQPLSPFPSLPIASHAVEPITNRHTELRLQRHSRHLRPFPLLARNPSGRHTPRSPRPGRENRPRLPRFQGVE